MEYVIVMCSRDQLLSIDWTDGSSPSSSEEGWRDERGGYWVEMYVEISVSG